jgi:S1-C subfamily serine protease
MHLYRLKLCLPVLAAAVALWPLLSASAEPPEAVVKAEAERVAAVERVRPAVVAVFSPGGKGGGSGVLISKDGYALTNFHVVQGSGPVMQCGLADGVLYDAVLVGLDKVGDVALIKLFKDKGDFPFAPLGDSDKLREGDWSLAMGNPFLLATDFTPTVTFGLISGVHRFQYPAGILLEYTDCIQIDTSINPGNSGGPLFNMKGELVGINGRGSFDKRGRVNSGVGYAISINQIKNFLGHLRAGLDSDHASLGATARTPDGAPLGTLQVDQVLEESDIGRRGLAIDDEIVAIDGRPLSSVNHLKNVLGLFPRGWRIPLEFRHAGVRKEVLVRLMGIQARGAEETDPTKPPPGKPGIKLPKQPPPNSKVAKFFRPKKGFANYYFNQVERDRLLADFGKQGDFKALAGNWTISGDIRLKQLRSASKATVEIKEETVGKSTTPVVRFKVDAFPYVLEPLKDGQPEAALKEPLGSGGFLSAMYLYQLLLTKGAEGFSKCDHGGYEPLYMPPSDSKMPANNLRSLRVDTEVLLTEQGAFSAKWFFSRKDGRLIGLEVRVSENEDPCEVYFADYRQKNGRSLPYHIQVRYGDGHYGTINVSNYAMEKSR